MHSHPLTYGSFEAREVHAALEALIFASSEPLSASAVAATLREADEALQLNDQDVDQLVDTINQELLKQTLVSKVYV